MKLRILDQEKVKKAISIQEAIQIVREIYKTIYRKEAVLPLRTQLSVEKEKGRCLFMPAFIPSKKALGTKIISIFPENLRKKLPTVQALIMIMDDETGIPIALMDGAFITALRTGAASGVATELLARKSARVASIFGAGRQGKTQLEAVCAVREIQKAWIYDPDQKAAEALLKEIKQEGSHLKGEIQIADSSSQALSEADIICTATTSYRPVFSDKELKEGAHINGIGSFTPEMQEIPTKTVLRAKIVVDSLSACLEEAGDLLVPIRQRLLSPSEIHGEIGEIALGLLPGREDEKEVTFFKTVGLAAHDIAVARKVYDYALQRGEGLEVEI